MRALAPRIGRLEARLAARAQASGGGICPVSASLRYLSDADLATVERLLDRFCADPTDPEARAAVQAFATWADRHAPILSNPGPATTARTDKTAPKVHDSPARAGMFHVDVGDKLGDRVLENSTKSDA